MMVYRQLYQYGIGVVLLFSCFFNYANDNEFDLSIEQLLDFGVTTASGVKESLMNVPGAMVVLTQADFARRNYLSLTDILIDLPGFDVIESNSSGHVVYYQRGYRSPWPTRTLLIIDGVVDNHLWTQSAALSRQYPLQNIERVEVLYGPASVVYGANAFVGIINVISKDPRLKDPDSHQFNVQLEQGSWHSLGIELAAMGKFSQLSYSISARQFNSEEEDFSRRWGFLANELYQDEQIWGPIRELKVNGQYLDHYADPTDDTGVLANLHYKGFKAGLIYWHLKEGLGTNYPADRGQANAQWQSNSKQYYLQYEGKLTKQIELKSLAIYRTNRIWGDWAEAEPDWNVGMENYSYISQTQWNSSNMAYEFKQDLLYPVDDNLTLSGGWRFKHSDVTKAYDVPGYWGGAYSSTLSAQEPGPYGFGAAIYHSSDSSYDFLAYPLDEMPDDNRQYSDDRGVYLGGSYQWSRLRFNLGLRYDSNSIWGGSLNPRLALSYHFNQGQSSIKAVYGEAFQEPPPNLLYGGWSGRKSNPDLMPEQANNIELIFIHQNENWLHDMSLFRAKYDHVIRENALNDGQRTIHGFEYRGKFEWPHFHPGLDAISGNFYYSYVKALTNRQYDHQQAKWLSREGNVGDISPHKVNFSLNWPLDENWDLNLKANYYHRTPLYSHNALAPQNLEVGSRVTLDAAVKFIYGSWQLNFKIENLADRKILAPGLRKANSGNDFSARSKGYMNSLTPLPGRSLWITVGYQF